MTKDDTKDPVDPTIADVAARQRNRLRAPPSPLAHAYTVSDAEAMAGLGRTTIYGMFASGRLKKIKVGGRTLVDGDSLRALLKQDNAA